MKKLKILYIINSLGIGGAEKALVSILKELSKNNYLELVLVSLEGWGTLEEDLKMWRHSGLGQRIYTGGDAELQALGISDHQIEDVKAVLELANGG